LHRRISIRGHCLELPHSSLRFNLIWFLHSGSPFLGKENCSQPIKASSGESLLFYEVTGIPQLKQEIGRFESVAACAAVLAMLSEIKRHQRNGAWQLLPDRYSDLRRSLSEIRGSTPLNQEQQQAVQAALVQLRGIEEQIERHLVIEDSKLDIPKLNKVVSKQADRITEIIIAIRNTLGDNHDG
jgi:hypothetical protein